MRPGFLSVQGIENKRMTQFAKEGNPCDQPRRGDAELVADYAMRVSVAVRSDARDTASNRDRRSWFAMQRVENDWNRPYQRRRRASSAT